MKRDIKFRVWDEKNKRMLYGVGMFDLSDADEKLSVTELEECPIMQFTGLMDRNGKEIYEGDVVNCLPWPEDTFLNNQKAIVVWNAGNLTEGDLNPNGFYCFYGMAYGDDPLDCKSYGKVITLCNEYVERIGNVFENPDLVR